MDWLANIGFSAAGFPWWAAFIVVLLTVLSTKVVDAWLRLRKSGMEERQYEDGEAKTARDQLVEQLKLQVKDLKADMQTVLSELKQVRTAHVNCEVAQAELRGEVAVLREKISALERHDAANTENAKKLAKIVKEETGKAPEIV